MAVVKSCPMFVPCSALSEVVVAASCGDALLRGNLATGGCHALFVESDGLAVRSDQCFLERLANAGERLASRGIARGRQPVVKVLRGRRAAVLVREDVLFRLQMNLSELR